MDLWETLHLYSSVSRRGENIPNLGSRSGPICFSFALWGEDYCRNAVQVSRRAGCRDLVRFEEARWPCVRVRVRWVYATIIPQSRSYKSPLSPDGEIAMRRRSVFMGKHGWIAMPSVMLGRIRLTRIMNRFFLAFWPGNHEIKSIINYSAYRL